MTTRACAKTWSDSAGFRGGIGRVWAWVDGRYWLVLALDGVDVVCVEALDGVGEDSWRERFWRSTRRSFWRSWRVALSASVLVGFGGI